MMIHDPLCCFNEFSCSLLMISFQNTYEIDILQVSISGLKGVRVTLRVIMIIIYLTVYG